MLIIGLTGGIGSGKTTVANLFAEQGIPIIDADIVARQVTERGTDALEKIVTHFGNYILAKDGTLNRKKLREVIFANPNDRVWLEQLLHPLIRNKIESDIAKLDAPYCITVIPLLFESDPFPFIHRVLVVDAPEHLQVRRAFERDKTDPFQIEAIIKTQSPRELRLAKANDVIVNDGSLSDLVEKVQQLHQHYISIAK